MKSSKKATDKNAPARGNGSPSGSARDGMSSPREQAESLLEACAATPRLQAFSAAVTAAGLTNLLAGDGPLTIFAPTDRAFAKLKGDHNLLNGDATRLAEVLRHHVVTGRVSAPRVTKPRKVTPEFGDDLELTRTDRGFHVDQARIVKTNIRAANGIIHAIDRVLDTHM
jgi:transforming growth factor-beta-induced protein